MNYLLDTNHWSYLQHQHPTVLVRIQNLPDEANLYMPVVAQADWTKPEIAEGESL